MLIEKVRSVVSDDTSQYRIVDLRPGTSSVTFELPGFSTVKRDGIALSGDFVATVNADLRVGALEETITVSGESPIVDVQSSRVQTIVDREVLAAIPTSRNADGIQAMIAGIRRGNTGTDIGDSGGITAGSGGMAGSIHGARPSDSRTMIEGINMGWAGANSNAAVAGGADHGAGGQPDGRRPESSATASGSMRLTNTDTAITYNNNYAANGAWLTPATIQPARYVRLNFQIDF
ncbi:MAG: Outer rane receptor for ferrienterochelin and colicin [Anaerolineales bacterium]|nr:Outer rane receptor for ferrienterochelin and colicin [Anaerolineales bacterium]